MGTNSQQNKDYIDEIWQKVNKKLLKAVDKKYANYDENIDYYKKGHIRQILTPVRYVLLFFCKKQV